MDILNTERLSKVIRASGGSIQTDLSHGIRLNKESTLKREFITVIDGSLPAEITKCTGIATVFKNSDQYSSGSYAYKANTHILAFEDVRAVQVRYLTFDVWGNHVKTLATTEIFDLLSGLNHWINSEWLFHSENEASEYYASIAYLSSIRTASGRVYFADTSLVIDEAKKFTEKFNVSDLEQKN
jgi:hypothetical protein